MKEMEAKQSDEQRLPILQKMGLLVKATTNFPSLMSVAEKSSIISKLEKDTVLEHFGKVEDQLKVFYLLLNAKSYPATKLLNLFNSTGNESVTSVLLEEEERNSSNSNEEAVEEKEKWIRLRKVITDNIDRLSSHTMNLGLVLCFASGVGLITGKDREIIVGVFSQNEVECNANYSTLEIDQLKKFFITVSGKEDGYDKLIRVLRMTNNNWALNVLQIND